MITVKASVVCNCRDALAEHSCPVHVVCDDNCGALRDPKTPRDWQMAALHWRFHCAYGGCAHGHQ
jgi:hypothetical protein